MTAVQQPHFVLVPLMAQGHMIPMLDMAHLLATRGATVSFITTPVNAARIKPDNFTESHLPIRLIELQFPSAEVGLPDGSENIDLIFDSEAFRRFFTATFLLREPLLHYLQNCHPRPTCFISDYCHPWTMHVSRALNIPRFVFHGPSCLFMLGSHIIKRFHDNIADVNEPFILPDLLPYQFTLTKAQLPGFFGPAGWDDLRALGAEAEATCDGVLLNSFDELEMMFIEKFRAAIQKPVWAVGPLCLYNKDITSKGSRGSKASIDPNRVLGWLDSKKAKSVIFVSFGSLVRTPPEQLIEIGSGLEDSGYPFIWVVKKVETTSEVDKWLDGFELRNAGRGLVIKGWAPQVVILSHNSIGGFVTHCGWNSTLEGVSAGVPLITWPHFADQFANEKLVVEVMKVGLAVGVTAPYKYGIVSDLVTRSKVEETLVRLIDGGEEMRERARVLGERARATMEEGGSSYQNLSGFIQYVSTKHGFSDGRVVSGCIIRDSSGKPLNVAGYSGVADSCLNAELWSIGGSIELISRLGYTNVTIETDCLNAVTLLLENPSDPPWRNLLQVRRCRSMLMVHPTVTVQHIRREANQVAHMIAQSNRTRGSNYQEVFNEFSFPIFINDRIRMESLM